MTITTKLIRLDDQAKTTYYDILRDGVVIGSAFRRKTGFNFENQHGCTFCKRMVDVKDLAANMPTQFTETLVKAGIPVADCTVQSTIAERKAKDALEAAEHKRRFA